MSVCGDCKAKFSRSCCEMPMGETPTMPLSVPEVKRIADHTKKAFTEFSVVEALPEEEVDGLVNVTPIFKSVLTRGTRIRLKTVPDPQDVTNTKCIFLKSEGCSLPKDVRPHGCRLFPYSYNRRLAKSPQGGVLAPVPPINCLAYLTASDTPDLMLSLLGTSEGELTQLGIQRDRDAAKHEELLNGE